MMRRLLPVLAVLAVLSPAAAFARDNAALSGLYDGDTVCKGGPAQVMVWIDIDRAGEVTGSVEFIPLKGSSGARSKVDIEGALTEDVVLKLRAKGSGESVLSGVLTTDDDDDQFLEGDLAKGGCAPLVLKLDPMSQM